MRKPKPPPLNIDKGESPLTVFAPLNDTKILAWVVDGKITTIVGPVSTRLAVFCDHDKANKLDSVRFAQLHNLLRRHNK